MEFRAGDKVSFLNEPLHGIVLSVLNDSHVIVECNGIEMDVSDIHTISCSKNSIWIVEEFGFQVNESTVLGVKIISNDTVVHNFNFNRKYRTTVLAVSVGPLRKGNYLIEFLLNNVQLNNSINFTVTE